MITTLPAAKQSKQEQCNETGHNHIMWRATAACFYLSIVHNASKTIFFANEAVAARCYSACLQSPGLADVSVVAPAAQYTGRR